MSKATLTVVSIPQPTAEQAVEMDREMREHYAEAIDHVRRTTNSPEVVFLPAGLYQRAVQEGFITAYDPRWRPAEPLPV